MGGGQEGGRAGRAEGQKKKVLIDTSAPQVLTWAKQHEQRLETALTEVLNNANLLEELLSWLQWAETTLVQRDTEPLPQDIPELKTLITEHQVGVPRDSPPVCGRRKHNRRLNAPLFVPSPDSLCCAHGCLWFSDVYGGDDEETARRGQSDQDLQKEARGGSQQPG